MPRQLFQSTVIRKKRRGNQKMKNPCGSSDSAKKQKVESGRPGRVQIRDQRIVVIVCS
jgi:hypothetical protein